MSPTAPEQVSAAAMTALHRVLCRLFQGDGQDLRAFVRRGPEGEHLVYELLSAPVSLSSLVQSWIDRSMARGLIDAGFFRRLMLAFPRRALEIHGIASQWKVVIAAPPAKPSRPRAWILVPGAIILALSTAWAKTWVFQPDIPAPLALLHPEPDPPSCVPTRLIPTQPLPRPFVPSVATAPAGDKSSATPDPGSARPPTTELLLVLLRRAAMDRKGLAGCWQEFKRSNWKLGDFEFHLKTDDTRRRVVVKTVDTSVLGVVSRCFERELGAALSRRGIRRLSPVTLGLAQLDPDR